jgi:hypothetical protein
MSVPIIAAVVILVMTEEQLVVEIDLVSVLDRRGGGLLGDGGRTFGRRGVNIFLVASLTLPEFKTHLVNRFILASEDSYFFLIIFHIQMNLKKNIEIFTFSRKCF